MPDQLTGQSLAKWSRSMSLGRQAFQSDQYLLAEIHFIESVRLAGLIPRQPIVMSKGLFWWALTCRNLGHPRKAQRLFMLAQRTRADPQGNVAQEIAAQLDDLCMYFEPGIARAFSAHLVNDYPEFRNIG